MKCGVVFAQRIHMEKFYYHHYVIAIKAFFSDKHGVVSIALRSCS